MSDDRSADQVRALRNDVASGVETAKDFAGKAQTAVTQAANTIRDAAIETGNRASDAAAKAYQEGAHAADYLSRSTAEQPLLALMIAGTIGYGIAYLIHRR